MPRLLIAAPHKSSGKTTITLGLCAALARRGVRVQPFKKGPDYIDPMWLGRAAERPCYNLDFNTMDDVEIRTTYLRRSADADLGLIEGNMGLFDSLDVEGTQSNASLAVLLQAPVVLVVNVKGMTRSVVPLIQGFVHFDPSVRIAGLILNHVAGARHEQRLREVIAHYLPQLPVVGAIYRSDALHIDERHLGLIPSNEEDAADRLLEAVADVIEVQTDLDALLAIAATAPALPSAEEAPPAPGVEAPQRVRIGIARDAAFGFYYPDDLEQLRAAGAVLVPFDALHDRELPPVDGLFIGGGFPETQMAALEANAGLRGAIYDAIESGLPVYAECGGLMYLCRSIEWQGERREMVGIVPADVVMRSRPQGRGLIRLEETPAAPWPRAEPGAVFNAHEFHYSRLENVAPGLTYAYKVVRGSGIDGRHDGIVYRNLLASYAHLRDVAGNHWTRRFVTFVARCGGREVSSIQENKEMP